MILKEMNFSGLPSKLPSFMIDGANEIIDAYLDVDKEMMEHYPKRLIRNYQLTVGGDSWAYLDSVQNNIIRLVNGSELVSLLCDKPKYFIQAMKACPINIIILNLYGGVSAAGKSFSDFSSITVEDFAFALADIAIKTALRDRENELEDHCDMVNDFIADYMEQ